VLVFRLRRPARLLVTVLGPGPSCARLGTFSRPGRRGVNEVLFSGTLFGRALAPGRYVIVVEAVRGSERVRIGHVLVVILARDGREGGSRPLAVPECNGGNAFASFASGGGDFSQAAPASSGGDDGASQGSGGIAGVSADSGDGNGLPLVPNLPALPALPSIPAKDSFDRFTTLLALAIGGTLGAAAFFLATGLRRRRDRAAWD
jgi:hypothetical protein